MRRHCRKRIVPIYSDKCVDTAVQLQFVPCNLLLRYLYLGTDFGNAHPATVVRERLTVRVAVEVRAVHSGLMRDATLRRRFHRNVLLHHVQRASLRYRAQRVSTWVEQAIGDSVQAAELQRWQQDVKYHLREEVCAPHYSRRVNLLFIDTYGRVYPITRQIEAVIRGQTVPGGS